jgi:cytoskeletal protein CcmA (bactofilin family)
LIFGKKTGNEGTAGIPEAADDGRPRRTWGQSGLTVVGSHTRIRGILKGRGPLLIQGSLEGEIDLEGSLIVPDGGRVDAEADVQTLELSGHACGSMKVAEHVRIGSTGSFEGSMATPVIETLPGSVLSGRAIITRPKPDATDD